MNFMTLFLNKIQDLSRGWYVNIKYKYSTVYKNNQENSSLATSSNYNATFKLHPDYIQPRYHLQDEVQIQNC